MPGEEDTKLGTRHDSQHTLSCQALRVHGPPTVKDAIYINGASSREFVHLLTEVPFQHPSSAIQKATA